MEARAQHQFLGTEADELAFQAGDLLKIIDFSDPNWLRAELNGREGLVPSNYINITPHGWFLGTMTRQTAQDVLLETYPNGQFVQPDGAFLVRYSGQGGAGSDFSISVKVGNEVQHFKIGKPTPGQYNVWEQSFVSVTALVNQYRNEPISRTHNVTLRDMVQKSAQMAAPAPVAAAAPPQKRVKAMFAYVAQSGEELSINEGDTITIISTDSADWWYGELRGKRGFVPSNYVKEI